MRVDPEEARASSAWFATPPGEQVWRDERRDILRLFGPVGGKRILDPGAGDGRLAVELAALGAEVTALDISLAMFSRAERRAQQNDVRITTVAGDLNAIPFPPGAFDRVVQAITVRVLATGWIVAIAQRAVLLSPMGVLADRGEQIMRGTVEASRRLLTSEPAAGRGEVTPMRALDGMKASRSPARDEDPVRAAARPALSCRSLLLERADSDDDSPPTRRVPWYPWPL